MSSVSCLKKHEVRGRAIFVLLSASCVKATPLLSEEPSLCNLKKKCRQETFKLHWNRPNELLEHSRLSIETLCYAQATDTLVIIPLSAT